MFGEITKGKSYSTLPDGWDVYVDGIEVVSNHGLEYGCSIIYSAKTADSSGNKCCDRVLTVTLSKSEVLVFYAALRAFVDKNKGVASLSASSLDVLSVLRSELAEIDNKIRRIRLFSGA